MMLAILEDGRRVKIDCVPHWNGRTWIDSYGFEHRQPHAYEYGMIVAGRRVLGSQTRTFEPVPQSLRDETLASAGC